MNVATNNDHKCLKAVASLENVYDPEINLNVVDLGLIYEINFNEDDTRLMCIMTLTTQFCPMGESIVEDVRNALQTSFPELEIDINLTFMPPWGYHRISEKGKEFLGS